MTTGSFAGVIINGGRKKDVPHIDTLFVQEIIKTVFPKNFGVLQETILKDCSNVFMGLY